MTKNLINLIRELNFLTLKNKSRTHFWLFLLVLVTTLISDQVALRELTELHTTSSLVTNFFFIPIYNRTHLKGSSYSLTNGATNNVATSRSIVSVPNAQASDDINKLNPWFITGLVDAEACFAIKLAISKTQKIGWVVHHTFQLGLHEKDRVLLEQIRNHLGVGNLYKLGKNAIEYRVSSIKDLMVIVNHFEKFPLITQKSADFELWKKALKLVLDKEHLTIEGLHKILSIKASMNWGLSDQLRESFPDIVPVKRPVVLDQEIRDPDWLAGFVSGEGCFFIQMASSSTYRTGFQVKLIFQVVQHVKDEALLRNIINYLDCGKLSKNRDTFQFVVQKFSDIENKILPFFSRHRIKGVKSEDLADWCEVAELIRNKAHLTEEGLDQIRAIKVGMNSMRS